MPSSCDKAIIDNILSRLYVWWETQQNFEQGSGQSRFDQTRRGGIEPEFPSREAINRRGFSL